MLDGSCFDVVCRVSCEHSHASYTFLIPAGKANMALRASQWSMFSEVPEAD